MRDPSGEKEGETLMPPAEVSRVLPRPEKL